mmetsp:Transcript_39876/g.89567  ORF Transcript_39876/g.89567 Transcript_39876/m.89567 type:complete len:208 (-) Transcript_39876:118-741(-)
MQSHGEQRSGGGEAVSHEEVITTYMITRLPGYCDRKYMLNVLRQKGFSDCIDFLYAPSDFASHKPKGYCFINFREQDSGRNFHRAFQGLQFSPSDQRLEVSPADIQGLAENVTRFFRKQHRKQIRKLEHLPLVFPKGDTNGTPLVEEYLPVGWLDSLNVEVDKSAVPAVAAATSMAASMLPVGPIGSPIGQGPDAGIVYAERLARFR